MSRFTFAASLIAVLFGFLGGPACSEQVDEKKAEVVIPKGLHEDVRGLLSPDRNVRLTTFGNIIRCR